MVSKGTSLKRKFGSDFQLEKNNYDIWVELFSPTSVEELAVHKKKVSEVELCIQKILGTNNGVKGPSIVLLTGPPGAGKTATVKAVCNALGIEMFIWSNKHQEYTKWTTNGGFNNLGDQPSVRETQVESFSRFLMQSKYSLHFSNRRISVVEEFPNAFVRDPAIFHNIIRRHSHYPVIFIISDNAKGDSLEGRLFPKDLQLSLKIQNISFNAIAPTLIMKVLTRINNSGKVHSVYKKLNKSEIENIASDCMGDIRSAINSMQFMCTSPFQKPLPVCSSSKEKSHRSKRDSSLFLFHSLGKILYCKRDPSLKSLKDTLPTHLKKFEKDPVVSNPEEVFEKTSISSDAFALFLQENYIHFVGDIVATSECAFSLSEADHLCSIWSGRDVMSDYVASLASRGLMFHLTPNSVGKKWRALHKPQFYESNAKQTLLTKSVKNAFRGTSLSMTQLQIDLVPFLSKFHLKDLSPAQLALLKEMGNLEVKKLSSGTKTLNEKDNFESEESVTEPNILTTDENLEILPDEEIVIEEYDF